MPVIIAPVDAYPANFTTLADGDAVSQANFVNSMQEFADAITYLRNRTVPAVPLTMSVALGGPGGTNGAGFAYDVLSGLWVTNAATPATIRWGIDFGAALPAGGPFQITGIAAWTININVHAGVPIIQQAIQLDYHNPASGSAALQNVATFSDTSAAPDLDVLHSFGVTGLAHTIISGASYSIAWDGESGGPAQPDTQLHAITITIEAV